MAGPSKEAPAPLPPVVMAAVSPVSYTEFYRVVTNDLHDGDPTAIFEDETPVHVGGFWATPESIVSIVCGDINPDAYLLFTKGGDRVPLRESSCKSLCVLAVEDALRVFQGRRLPSWRTFGCWDRPS